MHPLRTLSSYLDSSRSATGRLLTVVFAAFGLVLAGCSGDSGTSRSQSQQTPPAGNSSQQIPPPPAGSGQGETGMGWTAPAGWNEQQPSSGMRKAQFEVPGAAGAAELVVFYFGPNQGGSPMANAERWAKQFKTAEGAPALETMKTEEAEFGGMKTLLTEVEGTYRNSMVGQESFPNYKLLGAIVEGPDANWFFKLTGPVDTVEENRDGFLAFLSSLESGS